METKLGSRDKLTTYSPLEACLLDEIDDSETLRLLSALVAFNTENPPGSEAKAATWLAKFLQSKGFDATTVPVLPNRPNVSLCFGDPRGPRLLLNAHLDTMPAGSNWNDDPHLAVVRDGLLFGRGACDTKAGLAAMIEALLAAKRCAIPLRGEIALDVVVDEEGDGAGTRRTIELGRSADWAVVSEPTDLRVVRAGTGQVNFLVEFAGVAAHGSTPSEGHNAIYDASAFALAVESVNENMTEPVHPLLGRGSYSVGTIRGGLQPSIVADFCQLTVDRRILPGQSTSLAIDQFNQLVRRVEQARPGMNVTWRTLISIPPIELPSELPICQELAHAIEDVLGVSSPLAGMRATSDAAALIEAGIPAVVFGPGSIENSAHRPNEFVPLSEVFASSRAVALTMVRLLC